MSAHSQKWALTFRLAGITARIGHWMTMLVSIRRSQAQCPALYMLVEYLA